MVMRMAELSRESGVPVATIKYYIREGLVRPGQRTSRNQALYDEGHVRRLKLIRVLLDVGGLSISNVHAVLAAIDEQISTHRVLGIAQHGLPRPQVGMDEPTREWASALARKVIEERGWQFRPGHPVVETLVGTLSAFAELKRPELTDHLGEYAALAEQIAELDLATLDGLPDIESTVEGAVVATALGDVLLATLRRLAQQVASERRFGNGDNDGHAADPPLPPPPARR